MTFHAKKYLEDNNKYQELRETVKKSNDASAQLKELQKKQVAHPKRVIRRVQKSLSFSEIAQNHLKMQDRVSIKFKILAPPDSWNVSFSGCAPLISLCRNQSIIFLSVKT
jgi:hypothetical protein